MNTTIAKITQGLSNAQIAQMQRQLRSLRRQNKRLMEDLGGEEDLVQKVKAFLQVDPPYKFRPYPSLAKVKDVAVVVQLSDWHIGEVICDDEIEGVNAYNFEIARRRIFEIVEDILKWTQTMRGGYRIDELHLFCLADWSSGNIHEELIATNEFPAPIQAIKAGKLLGEVFRLVESHFKRVVAWEVAADNHGRLTTKVPYKKRAENNWSQVTYAVANEVASRCTRLNMQVAPGIKTVADVKGFKFLLTHGNDMRSWMGLPFYAIQRMFGREAEKRMRLRRISELSFDYGAIAHFHVPTVLENKVLLNGSLCGTTELDHANGRFAPPAQCAFLVSPTHGYFNWTPFRGR